MHEVTPGSQLISKNPLLAKQNRALLLAGRSYSPRQIAEETGLSLAEVTELLTEHKLTGGPCRVDECGSDRSIAGRPKHGWVQVRANGVRRWFCSRACAVRWLQKET